MGEPVKVGVGVTIGIPTYGRPVCMEWANAYKQLNGPINYNMRFGQVWHMKIAEARNSIVKLALEQKSKFLFFLGDDVVVPGHTLRKLIYRMENIDDIGIIGGIYCSKVDPAAPLVFRGNGEGSYWKWKVGELFQVTGLGMDATLIRCSVFEEMEEPWFKTVSEDDYEAGISNAEAWTEDLWFCKRVLEETDYKIYADASIMCEHWDAVERKKYVLPADSYPMQRVENPKKMVDLGCGKTVWEFEGEGTPLRVDIREEANPDYRSDLRDLPFADEQFSVAFSSHVLEHFDRNEVGAVLDEWIRIIEDGGELRLVVPNLEWAAKNVLDGKLDFNTLNVFYGQQDYKENFHKMGFTPKSLRKLLEDRGLEVVEENLEGFHILMRAKKPEKESENGNEIEEESESVEQVEMKDLSKELQPTSLQLKEQPHNLGSGGPKSRILEGKEL
jgi:predicted SAM-dependent methyltransferase